MKKLIILTLVLSMVFAPIMSSAETKGFYREEYQLTPTAKIVGVIQIYGTAWYGGATQGFQALVQWVPSQKLTREKVTLEWGRQYGTCPNEDQIKAVLKGWDEAMVWFQEKGAMEEIVTIFSKFNLPLEAPGPKVLAAIVRGVAELGSAAIGGLFFRKAFASLQPDQYYSNTQQTTTGGGAKVGPVTASSNVENQPNFDVKSQAQTGDANANAVAIGKGDYKATNIGVHNEYQKQK